MTRLKETTLAHTIRTMHGLWAIAVFVIPLTGAHTNLAGDLYIACIAMAYFSLLAVSLFSGTLYWLNVGLFPFSAFWLIFLLLFDCAPNAGVIDNLVKTSIPEIMAWSKHQVPLLAAVLIFWGMLIWGAVRLGWPVMRIHRKYYYLMCTLCLAGMASAMVANDMSRIHQQYSAIPFINNSSLTEITWINESGWPMGWITITLPMNNQGPTQLVQAAAMSPDRPVIHPLQPDSVVSDMTVVLVIGESHRADWLSPATRPQLLPELNKRWQKQMLTELPNVWSNSNLTMYSVPAMLTGTAPNQMMEGIYRKPSGLGYLKQAGFYTAYVTNQSTPLFAEKGWDYFKSPGISEWHDQYLANEMQRLLISPHRKKALVLQMMGSHFYYEDRYPEQFAKQHRAIATQLMDNAKPAALEEDQKTLFRNYLISIAYSGTVLEQLLLQLDRLPTPAVLIFCSDHGENLFDDQRQYYWHSVNGNPGLPEFRPAAFIAWNAAYGKQFSSKLKQMKQIAGNTMQQQQILPVWMRMAGFHLPAHQANDPFSPSWQVIPDSDREFYVNRKVVKASTLTNR